MKKVAILDECKSIKDLETLINAWIKANEKNVISIDVKNYVVNYKDALLDNLYRVFWYAVVTYEE